MRKTRLIVIMSAVWLASALAYGHARAAQASTALSCPNDGMLYQGSCTDVGGPGGCNDACEAAFGDPSHTGYCSPSGYCCICEY